MKAIKRIAVLGAGAMGATFAALLYDMDPACVVLLAEGDRKNRLQAEGLTVQGRHYPIPVQDPATATEPAELILIALKQHHLEHALPTLKPIVNENTLFLSVMNGLDSEPAIGALYGMETVLYAIAVGIDAQREGNAVHYSSQGTLFFGDAANDPTSSRVQHVQQLFDRAGIHYETPKDMIRTMWWKFLINVGVNQASSVTGAPYGIMKTSPDAQYIMEGAMREVVALAQASGVNLSEQDIIDWYGILNKLDDNGMTSMLQDVKARRKTEVDMLAGKVVAMGEQHNVPTPINNVLLHTIRAIEAQYLTH